jgi:hypothetical protein
MALEEMEKELTYLLDRQAIYAVVAINDCAAPSINTQEAFQTPEGATNNECLEPFEWDVVAGVRDRSDPSYERPLSVPESRRRQYREMKAAAGKPPKTAKKTG